MVKIPTTLVEELIKRNLLTRETANEMIVQVKAQDKDLGLILSENNIIGEKELLVIKSEFYNMPSVDLPTYEINKEALKTIPEDTLKLYQILPFDLQDNVLRIGVVNPENIEAMEAIKLLERDYTLEKYLITCSDFNNILRSYKTLVGEVKEVLETLTEELAKKEAVVPLEKIQEVVTEEAPIIRTVAVIVKHAAEGRASDIHIEPYEDKLRIRFRVDGVLRTALILPKTLHSPIVTRIKILTDMQIDETRKPQDGRFSTVVGEKKLDFRVSTLPTRYGEKVVMRILDPLMGLIDLPELGLVGRNLELIGENIKKPFGSILITGPTGSGKTSTLYAILRRINEEGVNIVTLEDPIEFLIEGIGQSQIQEEIGFTFATGLRHILRQDPDIIMVGEIRDAETAALATHAALTGHLVFSTLHTNDAIGIIPRLIDMKVEKYLITPTLNLGVAQRLLRRLCPACKTKTKTNAGEEEIITQAIKIMPENAKKDLPGSKFTIFKPNEGGCKECNGKAYKGRIAVFEILDMTSQLEEIILTRLSEATIREEAERQGMLTMFQDGIIKVLEGVISLEELLQVTEIGNA